jgi:hypothetical protein
MTTIVSKIKEIIVVGAEQKTISELANVVVDKAQIFYTQLKVVHLVATPMIEKIETIDRKSPQVMEVDVNEVVQLTQQLHDTLDEFDNQFKESLQEFMNTVPFVASITP